MVHDSGDWWRNAVTYQIYPRSFADSNGDGIGDLGGIISRVPYLADLGVDAVWLSPFYPSELADGGYDVIDPRAVDPRIGTLDEFDELVGALHGVGIRVIVDVVPNHTSDQRQWFLDAMAAGRGSAERERYVFREGRGPDGSLPPNNWPSHFGPSSWTRVDDGQWYLHLFAPEQPDLNWDHPEVRADALETLRFWGDRGVDGFRVDVAHALAKDLSEPYPEITTFDLESVPLDGSHPLFDRDEVHRIYSTWREVFNEYDPPLAAVAESWVHPERRIRYATPAGLGQTFNFDLLTSPWDAKAFHDVISKNLALSEIAGSSSTWVLSNHDVVRHASRYGLPPETDLARWLMNNGIDPIEDLARGSAAARAATALLLALPGSTYLYQGEELGLREVADLPADRLQDPVWIRSGKLSKGRDGCRVPLPWAAQGPSFGFGTGGAHLSQPPWFGNVSVEVQDADPGSSLALYRGLLALRRRLNGPEPLVWHAAPKEVLHFSRGDHWHCVVNFSDAPVAIPLSEVYISSDGSNEISELAPHTAVWGR